jgi:nucleoid-associated protein YgaU
MRVAGGCVQQGPAAAGRRTPQGAVRTCLALGLVLAGLAAPGLAADGLHVVQPGETLWQIAANLSGDARRWPELYRANRDQIKDPSRLYPGQRLAIPDFASPPPPEPAAQPAPPVESE